MKDLKLTQFGNPVLRQVARPLAPDEILSDKVQNLIWSMNGTLTEKKLGVGLAAPQVGESLALAVINIQKTALRPRAKPFKLVIINPKITKTYGYRVQKWEGCISSGNGRAGLFAKVPRYRRIELEYMDENSQEHKKVFGGLPAHVIQHEVDHLNGILFVDKVKDTTTFMTYDEYKQARRQKRL